MTDYEQYVKNNRDLLKGKEKLSQNCDWDYQSKEYGIPLILMSLPYLEINYSWCDTYIGILRKNKITNLSFQYIKGVKQNLELFSNLYFLKELTLADNLIETISKLKNLEFLSLEYVGSIESISALEKCQNLKEIFIAYGTTNIVDGDLSVFFELPKLKKILIEKKKHYSHTNEELHKHTGQ